METFMKTPVEFARQYIAIWNETDAARRRALIDAAFSPDATYRDPLMQGAGHEGIATMIAGAQAQLAGCRFALCGVPDGHNDVIRFSWTVGVPGQPALARGTDVATIADGRIRSVVGFLDAEIAQAA
jgi:hypothetical protein